MSFVIKYPAFFKMPLAISVSFTFIWHPYVSIYTEIMKTFYFRQNHLEFFPMFIGVLWVAGIFFHQRK